MPIEPFKYLLQGVAGCPTKNYTLFTLLGKTNYNFVWDTLYDGVVSNDRLGAEVMRLMIRTAANDFMCWQNTNNK